MNLPLYRGQNSVVKNAGKHVIKYPEKAAELGKAMVKYGAIDTLPNDGVKVALLNLYWEGVATRFIKESVTSADVLKVAKSGSLEKTIQVVKRGDGAVAWLEEGRLVSGNAAALGTVYDIGGSGWIHIKNNHFQYQGHYQFAEKFGAAFENEEKVKELIMNGAKNGQKIDTSGVYHYIEPNSDKSLELIIGDNGYVVSAYPLKG